MQSSYKLIQTECSFVRGRCLSGTTWTTISGRDTDLIRLIDLEDSEHLINT